MKNSQIKELIETHFPTFSKLARLSYRQITFAFVTFGIVLSIPGNAIAWTWVLHHNGHSPAPTGPSINGGGRLIQRQNYNPGSNSQRWSFVENGNGRHMIVNLASKNCMNVYLAKPQSRPNDYPCNRNDPEQQFRVHKIRDVRHSQPAMDVMIKVADIRHNGRDLCLDDVNGHFQLHYCNPNNANMVFRMDRVSTYIASDVVDRGTQANQGGGNTLPPTLPRTGGSNIPRRVVQEGVQGYIYYARFCNKAHEIQFDVSVEATSKQNEVEFVQLNMYSAIEYGYNIKGFPLAHSASAKWRPVNSVQYNNGKSPFRPSRFYGDSDRRWYKWTGKYQFMSSATNSPVKFGTRVHHENGSFYDIGGILDLGDIPVGECRRLEGEKLYNY